MPYRCHALLAAWLACFYAVMVMASRFSRCPRGWLQLGAAAKIVVVSVV